MPTYFVPIRYRLTPTARGTRITQSFGKGRGPLRLMGDLVVRGMGKQAQIDIDKFRDAVEADWADHAHPAEG